jgi:hypothetical protein
MVTTAWLDKHGDYAPLVRSYKQAHPTKFAAEDEEEEEDEQQEEAGEQEEEEDVELE